MEVNDELVSKKDLLNLTGISYGQLYRWKRKSLIPEEWFIRKSTFTGQETFFPKNKILDRINKIKNMKEDVSLDDLAEMFSPSLAEIFLNKAELLEKDIVSNMTMDIYTSSHRGEEVFSFEKILYLSIVEKFLKTGNVSREEGREILETLEENYKSFEGGDCQVVFIRKLGVSICFLMEAPFEVYLEKNAKLVDKLNVSKCIEDLKTKI